MTLWSIWLQVFPALREWCEERQLHLVECDLRWGVPKDSTTRATLIACMEEIDRCCYENDGQPFFLNMLGERSAFVFWIISCFLHFALFYIDNGYSSMLKVDHNKIIFLSTPFPVIQILAINCCYNVIFVLCKKYT